MRLILDEQHSENLMKGTACSNSSGLAKNLNFV